MSWRADVDPALLRQPDRRSCGAATVVAARTLLTPWRPEDPAQEILEEHRLLTSRHSPLDRLQMPWPRALGTPPWAVANALSALTHGRRIATVHTRPRPYLGYAVMHEQLRTRPVAAYLGSRWLPRHVVLALSAYDGGVEVFDPASGRVVGVAEERWTTHTVGVAGWDYVWFVV